MLSEESKLQNSAVSSGVLKCRHQDKIRHANNLLGEPSMKEKGKELEKVGRVFRPWCRSKSYGGAVQTWATFLNSLCFYFRKCKISILFNFEGSKLGNVKYLQQSLAHSKSYEAFFCYFHHNT